MKQISLSDASATDLSEYANANLGLETYPKMGKDKILAVMSQAGFDKEHIEVSVPEVVNNQMQGLIRKNHQDPAYQKKVTVTLLATEEKGGRDPHFVAVNGVGMLIPRGKPVPIPYPYYEVLKNAKKFHYDTDNDGKITGRREVPAHPHQVEV